MGQAILLGVKNAIMSAVIAALVASTGTYAANSLINGHRIADHTIPASKLTARAAQSLHGQRGVTGPQGLPGPAGPQGVSGAFSISNVTTYIGANVTIAAGASGFASVACPTGQIAVGGGGEGNGATLTDSKPSPSISTAPLAWIIAAKNETAGSVPVRAFVICVH